MQCPTCVGRGPTRVGPYNGNPNADWRHKAAPTNPGAGLARKQSKNFKPSMQGSLEWRAAVMPMAEIPKPQPRAYPARYVSEWTMKDGTRVTIRPIRPGDEALMAKFHESLSDRSVRLRYFYTFSLASRTARERLIQICSDDYDRQIALVAERTDPGTERHEILAVGRLSKLESSNEAEVAALVADRWQQHGLGSELLRRLVQIARDERLVRVVAEMLRENAGMRTIVQRLGFRFVASDDPALARAVLDL
jgi:acetyltransferase